MLTDSYGNKHERRGARLITGPERLSHRLSKVGIPSAANCMNEKTSRSPRRQNQGYAPASSAKPHLGEITRAADQTRFDEFYGNLNHLNANKSRSRRLSRCAGCFRISHDFRPRAGRHALPSRRTPTIRTVQPRGAGRKAEDRGYRPSHEEAMAACDDELRARGQGIHEKRATRGQAVLRWLNTTHSDASHSQSQKRPFGQADVAITLSRHDDRPDKNVGQGADFFDEAGNRDQPFRHASPDNGRT